MVIVNLPRCSCPRSTEKCPVNSVYVVSGRLKKKALHYREGHETSAMLSAAATRSVNCHLPSTNAAPKGRRRPVQSIHKHASLVLNS